MSGTGTTFGNSGDDLNDRLRLLLVLRARFLVAWRCFSLAHLSFVFMQSDQLAPNSRSQSLGKRFSYLCRPLGPREAVKKTQEDAKELTSRDPLALPTDYELPRGRGELPMSSHRTPEELL